MWEKEAIENSGWLLRATIDTKGATEGLQECTDPGKESLSSFGVEGRIPRSDKDCIMSSNTNTAPNFSAGVPVIS